MGFFDFLHDTIGLTKNTFTIVGKNPEILKPTFAQIKIGLLFLFLLVASALTAFLFDGAIQGAAVIVFFVFLLLAFPLFPFIRMYYKAAQSWIVYNAFTGKQATYQDGLRRASQNKGDIITLAIFDILANALAGRLKGGTGKGGLVWGIVNVIMWIIGRVVEEAWDLVGHFLLPASIIQEKKVTEVLPELKNIRKNATGALAGVLGFDFAGDLIRGYITAILIVFLIISVFVASAFNNWILFLVVLILVLAVNAAAKTFIDMTKTIYFTLFYMAVTMPMKIKPEYRQEVTNYLLHRETEKTVSVKETDEEKINKLLPYIVDYRQQGYNDKDILKFLAENNWPEDIVKKALKKRR